jgi:type I restriction enzyme S subunit
MSTNVKTAANRSAAFTPLQRTDSGDAANDPTPQAMPAVKRPQGRAPKSTAPTGRKKTIGHRSSAIGNSAQPLAAGHDSSVTPAPTGRKKIAQGKDAASAADAALGNASQNTSSPEGAKEMSGKWKRVRVGDTLRLVNGSAFKPTDWTKDGLPIVRIQNLNNPDAPFNLTTRELPEKFRLRGGELLFAWSGTPGTSFGAHIWRGGEAWLNQHIFNVLFDENQWDKKFLQFAINQNLSEYIRAAHGGAGLAHITKGKFENSELAQPPLPEQRRTVAEIEKQFTRLEAGVTALRRVQANLKRYRAAVLKAACEGKLVENEVRSAKREGRSVETGEQLLKRILAERRKHWEESNRNSKTKNRKYVEPAAPDTANLPPLPEGWTWASVEQVGEATTGFTPPKGNALFFGGSIPFFKPTDLDAGYYVREFRDSLTESGAEHGRLLPERSILVTCIGATIGKTGFARVRCATNQQINALTVPSALVSPEFVFWFFNSPLGQKQIKENASATTLPILNKSKFEALALPLPPLAEQTRIVAEVERRLSVVEELESVVSANLQRASRLRQSILQKAFSGELI